MDSKFYAGWSYIFGDQKEAPHFAEQESILYPSERDKQVNVTLHTCDVITS